MATRGVMAYKRMDKEADTDGRTREAAMTVLGAGVRALARGALRKEGVCRGDLEQVATERPSDREPVTLGFSRPSRNPDMSACKRGRTLLGKLTNTGGRPARHDQADFYCLAVAVLPDTCADSVASATVAATTIAVSATTVSTLTAIASSTVTTLLLIATTIASTATAATATTSTATTAIAAATSCLIATTATIATTSVAATAVATTLVVATTATTTHASVSSLDWGTGWARHLDSAGTAVVASLGEELYLLALAKAAEAIGDDAGLVNEQVLAAAFGGNEAVALGAVEPLASSADL